MVSLLVLPFMLLIINIQNMAYEEKKEIWWNTMGRYGIGVLTISWRESLIVIICMLHKRGARHQQWLGKNNWRKVQKKASKSSGTSSIMESTRNYRKSNSEKLNLGDKLKTVLATQLSTSEPSNTMFIVMASVKNFLCIRSTLHWSIIIFGLHWYNAVLIYIMLYIILLDKNIQSNWLAFTPSWGHSRTHLYNEHRYFRNQEFPRVCRDLQDA